MAARTENMKHLINSEKVLRLARKHLGNNSSARACMKDSIAALNRGELDLAMRWALRSLAHSIGILHVDYKAAFNASGISGQCGIVLIV